MAKTERSNPRETQVRSTNEREGSEIAQVYAALPETAAEPPKRLVGFTKIQLKPGETKEVTVNVDGKYLSIFDESANVWKLVPGSYNIMVGGSSKDLPLTQKVNY